MMDFETMLWRRLPPAVDCPSGRRYHTAVLSNVTQKLYVYGGSTVTKAPEDFLYVLDTTLLPGLEEWTFDEAQDIIKQGIRSFTRALKTLPPLNGQTTAPLSPLASPSLPLVHNPYASTPASAPSSSNNWSAAATQASHLPPSTSPPSFIPTPFPLHSSSSSSSLIHNPNASASAAIDIGASSSGKAGKDRSSKPSSSPSSSSASAQVSLSSSFGSLKRRKKPRSESESDRLHTSGVAQPSGETSTSPLPSSSSPNAIKNLNLNAPFYDTTEEQAVEAVRLLKLHFKRLKREKEELRTATEAFQLQQRRFEEMTSRMGTYMAQHGDGNVVKLNVGGFSFQTTTTTLTSYPDSMLSAMFSGRYKLPTDEKGRVFIDRDGTHFRYILNFLRDGTLNVAQDHVILMDILQEAQFYQLHKLVQLIKTLLKDLLHSLSNNNNNNSNNQAQQPNSSSRTRLTAAQRALSISELATNPCVPRTGTSPDFDDYWGNL